MLRTSLASLVLVVTAAVGCNNESAAVAQPDAKSAADQAPESPPTAHAAHPAVAQPHAAVPDAKGPPRDITPSGETTPETVSELQVAIPKEWEKRASHSPMRLVEWTLPGPGGDGEMVVYRFAGGAGGVDANIARWKGQFVPPAGKTIDDLAQIKTIEVGALKVTSVDITGHYQAAAMPGQPEQRDEADYRMLAAIIEGSGDAFFFKGLGPQKTMDPWAKPFADMLGGVSTK